VRREVLVDIDPTGLEAAVGAAAHARGVQYVRNRAVVRALWDPSTRAIRGTVRGRLGNLYRTTAHFSSDDGLTHRFEMGECSCPVGFDCKHAAALVLNATGLEDRRVGSDRDGRSVRWEQLLASLVESRPAGSESRPGGTPLAIELTLSAPAVEPAPKLLARLVQPGKNGWVSGGLSWTRLDTLRHHGDYVASQVRLLREMYAVYGSRDHRPSYYSFREEKSIEMTAFESRRLWSLLDEAEAIGLRLVHARKRLGSVDRYGSAEVCLDVTVGEGSGSLSITPVVTVDGTPADAAPVVFIGTQGHGLVYVGRAEMTQSADRAEWPFRIAQLAKPAPRRLQQLALSQQHLEVPAVDQSRFRDEYYPRLRQLATVTSSDESFTPPAISDPTLVLRASYGAEHNLGLRWEWAYDVGEARLRAPLHPNQDAGYRDLDAERRVLDSLDIGLEEFGLRGADADQGLAPQVKLSGIETMRFSTEVLPLLDGHAGVLVEVSGEPADYREAGDSLRIGVSTDDVAGETDWFDLGVTITVEGREVPFMDVFVALSRNESHLLLADGAYFSLEKPELQALRRLIDEARGLQDKPDDPLRISRFQAGLWDELAELGVVNRQAQAWQRQVGGLLALDSIEPTPQPAALAAQLRPYQADGFGWLAFLWKYRLGGILADDMGLGKTLQSLALICHAQQADPDGMAPFLITAPTSVVANWAAEAARFAPELTVVPISDTLRRRGRDLDEIIGGADVVVTSYTLFRLDFAAYSALDWSGLLLDEAQFVKNHQSKAYQCARRLPAPFKLAITGTPMENNLMELWSLLSITAPGLFASPNRFRDYYARPIEKGDDELLAQLRRRVKPLVKRRTKEQVAADLPAKQEQVLEVELHPRHRTIYQRHLQRERQKVLGLIDDLNRNRFTILRSLTLLRQLSLHAGLVDDKHHDLPSSKIDALLEQL
jgi:hypothetical protein